MYERELKAYCKQVEKHLPGGAEHRAAYQAYLLDSAEEILHDTPVASFDELQTALGTPEEIAEAYQSTLPPEQLAAWAAQQKRRKHLMVGLIGLILAVLAGLVVYYYVVRGVVVVEQTTIIYPEGAYSDASEIPTPIIPVLD